MLKTGEPFAMAGIYATEPTGIETAEKNPVNFRSSRQKETGPSVTSTTGCP
jgi:hypothetical protein